MPGEGMPGDGTEGDPRMHAALVRAPGADSGGDKAAGGRESLEAVRFGRPTGSEDMGPIGERVERLLELLVGGRMSEEVVGWIR